MTYTTRNLPFKITDINLGFQEANGMIRLDNENFFIEYQVKDAIAGFMKGDVEEIKLSLDDIDSIQFKKGWISGKLLITVKSMKKIEDFPGAEGVELKFIIPRKYRDSAKSFESKARLALSEHRLKELESD